MAETRHAASHLFLSLRSKPLKHIPLTRLVEAHPIVGSARKPAAPAVLQSLHLRSVAVWIAAKEKSHSKLRLYRQQCFGSPRFCAFAVKNDSGPT